MSPQVRTPRPGSRGQDRRQLKRAVQELETAVHEKRSCRGDHGHSLSLLN